MKAIFQRKKDRRKTDKQSYNKNAKQCNKYITSHGIKSSQNSPIIIFSVPTFREVSHYSSIMSRIRKGLPECQLETVQSTNEADSDLTTFYVL